MNEDKVAVLEELQKEFYQHLILTEHKYHCFTVVSEAIEVLIKKYSPAELGSKGEIPNE